MTNLTVNAVVAAIRHVGDDHYDNVAAMVKYLSEGGMVFSTCVDHESVMMDDDEYVSLVHVHNSPNANDCSMVGYVAMPHFSYWEENMTCGDSMIDMTGTVDMVEKGWVPFPVLTEVLGDIFGWVPDHTIHGRVELGSPAILADNVQQSLLKDVLRKIKQDRIVSVRRYVRAL